MPTSLPFGAPRCSCTLCRRLGCAFGECCLPLSHRHRIPLPASPCLPCQVRRTFEDLYLEARRIRAGKPTLPMTSLPAGWAAGPAKAAAGAAPQAASHGSASRQACSERASPAGSGPGPQRPALRPLRVLPPAAAEPCPCDGRNSSASDVSGTSVVVHQYCGVSGGPSSGASCDASCGVGSPFAAWSQRGFDSRPPAGLVAANAASWPSSHPLRMLRMRSGCSSGRGSESGGGSASRSSSCAGQGAGLHLTAVGANACSPLALAGPPTSPAALSPPSGQAAVHIHPNPWLLPAAAAVWLLVLAVQLLAAAAWR